jgi:hypothetical protein
MAAEDEAGCRQEVQVMPRADEQDTTNGGQVITIEHRRKSSTAGRGKSEP